MKNKSEDEFIEVDRQKMAKSRFFAGSFVLIRWKDGRVTGIYRADCISQ